MNDLIDSSNEYWDAQIESTEKYYDTLIENMEAYQNKWDELSDMQEHAEMIGLLKELGYTEEDLLNSSSGAYEAFRNTYLSVLNDLNAGNQNILDGLSAVAGVDMSSIPSYLKETQGYIDSISNMDVTSIADGFSSMNSSLESMATNASNAASAISGGGSAQTTSQQSSTEGTTGANNSNNASGTGGSIKESIQELSTEGVAEINKVADAFAGDGKEGNSVLSAVQKVIQKIGSGEESDTPNGETPSNGQSDKEGSSDSLLSTIKTQTQQALDKKSGIPAQKRAWEELNTPLGETVDYVSELKKDLEGLDGKEFSITLNVKGDGASSVFTSDFHGGGGKSRVVDTNAKGTVGKAFAEGTGKYKGLPKAEKNALVSEYGQTEMTVLPNGKAIITDEPTMIDLPKDTVIFNEEQTKKIMDNKINAQVVKSYANGTVEYSDGTVVTPDGVKLRPIQPGDRAYELQKAFEPLLKKIDGNLDYLTGNVMAEHSRQMEKMINQLSTTNVVTNTKNVRPVINGGINITCPGITSQEVAKQVGVELDHMFNGLHLDAMQQSMKR